MAFPNINGPSDPEEYSWEVILDKDQSLVAIDSQTAEVVYEDDGTVAFTIVAEQAHDAMGSTVPTSLAVSEDKIVTLTVYHREGNPAAEGAPFEYPVVAGPGFERGFESSRVFGPEEKTPEESAPEEQPEAATEENCLVPKLRGRTLRQARRVLRKRGCRLGNVRRRRVAKHSRRRVLRQSPKPGARRSPGASVSVTLAVPHRHRSRASRSG